MNGSLQIKYKIKRRWCFVFIGYYAFQKSKFGVRVDMLVDLVKITYNPTEDISIVLYKRFDNKNISMDLHYFTGEGVPRSVLRLNMTSKMNTYKLEFTDGSNRTGAVHNMSRVIKHYSPEPTVWQDITDYLLLMWSTLKGDFKTPNDIITKAFSDKDKLPFICNADGVVNHIDTYKNITSLMIDKDDKHDNEWWIRTIKMMITLTINKSFIRKSRNIIAKIEKSKRRSVINEISEIAK